MIFCLFCYSVFRHFLFYLFTDGSVLFIILCFRISYFTCLRMVLFYLLVFVLEFVFLLVYGWFFFYLLVHVSAFLCYLTKKRRQRKQKIFLFEEKKHLLKKSPSTNLPIDQPFLLEVVFCATSTTQALSVTSLNLLSLTSVLKKQFLKAIFILRFLLLS